MSRNDGRPSTNPAPLPHAPRPFGTPKERDTSDLVGKLRERADHLGGGGYHSGWEIELFREAAARISLAEGLLREGMREALDHDRTYHGSWNGNKDGWVDRAERFLAPVQEAEKPHPFRVYDQPASYVYDPEVSAEELQAKLREAEKAGAGTHNPNDPSKCVGYCLECEYGGAPAQNAARPVQADVPLTENWTDIHWAREWSPPYHLEAECPCPKEPCGMVAFKRVLESCPQHALRAAKTLRSSHRASACNGEGK